ncbi:MULTISPECIES: fumarylacetoacetate hydrolase family protein [Vibrio]|jgi:2-oxopent-4-enoate/cis-2-oxohex-4-enoate hydratase|uniref:fumarylacetoacetate hydrolase family protein n=1 Tax=Vibrio TaxID=662 RepID=UPI000BFFF579|nr:MULTISPECIES: fumarylacetoacetate hydrolase family protein [unclassified Vibrio]PHJ41892.1 2-keto-4-pentenoate hydratase [Vibrio sp. PID17_43]RIZ52968.1 2-keto-4-pentenoate hydratase [Vibrio sp. PID23_8]
MSNIAIEKYGEQLYQALRQRKTIAPLVSGEESHLLTIDDAYQISLHALEKRAQDGEVVIGKKIGVTSKAVQEMLNVHQPDFGFLTDSMHYPDGSEISLAQAKLIQPRAEGEIAFCLKQDLIGPGVTAEQVIEATEWVAPCFEIVDSRIENWQISIIDTVADNASCGVFVIGESRVDPRTVDLALAQMKVYHNGELAVLGLGSAVQGHPAEAVAWLANTLGEYGIPFKKGEIILSGALAPLIDAKVGDRFDMEIEGLGKASISFAE